MLSKITNQLQRKKPLKLMTHVVAGYPDMATTVQTVKLMEQCGVDIIEIQLPFTDPIADGPTILKACQKSLDKGTTVNHCFDLLDALQDVHIP
ncbi:MAG TPA: tryptophan synthase subunit alpha, partial [Spirochaetota bacterium]|nr:tryptophan synthase subunit alpha [Spirochaetota bacterium]